MPPSWYFMYTFGWSLHISLFRFANKISYRIFQFLRPSWVLWWLSSRYPNLILLWWSKWFVRICFYPFSQATLSLLAFWVLWVLSSSSHSQKSSSLTATTFICVWDHCHIRSRSIAPSKATLPVNRPKGSPNLTCKGCCHRFPPLLRPNPPKVICTGWSSSHSLSLSW